MNKNTKLIIGGLSLVALFLSYKKGLFGGNTSSGPSASSTPSEAPKGTEFFAVSEGDAQTAIVNNLPSKFGQGSSLNFQ